MDNNLDLETELIVNLDPSPVPFKRQKSIVWTNFERRPEKNEDGTDVRNVDGTLVMKAFCKMCHEPLVYGGTSGTSHLKRHMERCVKKSGARNDQPIVGRTDDGGVYYFTFNQNVARRETVRYFVREELSFNKVDKTAFRRWIRLAFGPQFTPPCRNTMKKDVMKFHLEGRVALKEVFRNVPGKVSFTSDLWTSKQRLGYMCITAHYITKDWVLNKRIISFPMLPSPHTGKAIADAMYANLVGWDLSGKVGTLTLDNATNSDSAVRRLKDSLFGDDSLSKELFHMRCNAHILNLLVKAGTDHFKSSLENIRETVKNFKTSQAKLQRFHKECQNLNLKVKTLPIDIITRWDSTYLMLEAAIPYEKVVDLFFYQSDFAYIPSRDDWNNAIIIRDFLKIFAESTKLFSGTKYVTSSLVCYQLSKIALLMKRYAKVPAFVPLHKDMMELLYEKYWKDVPLVLGLASCMDPRFKLTTLDLCLELHYESDLETTPSNKELKMSIITNKLTELFERYQLRMNANVVRTNEESSDYVEEDDISRMLSQRREASVLNYKSDLQRYLDQPTIQIVTKDFNVLNWWKSEQSTYPVLSALARDLLTIPVSTVPSESAFSASERVISKSRTCLLPETVEALMCLKDWYQAEEGLQDEDSIDMEELMKGGGEL